MIPQPAKQRRRKNGNRLSAARASTTESAIALLPIVLLPILALGGGVRPAYKMPLPARWISTLVPSRWAFERNVVTEARAHVCGYPPGLQPWDACPTDGKGVDAATTVVPEAVTGPESNPEPASLASAADANAGVSTMRSLRYSFAQTVSVLSAMLLALLAAVLASLKSRDVH